MIQKDKLTELIGKFSRLVAMLENQVMSRPEFKDITLKQFYYLDFIRTLKDPTITKITKEFNITKPTATITVNKLVDQGLVKKVQSTEDGRIFKIELTAKGNKINAAHDKCHEMIVKNLVVSLSELDIAEFTRILGHLIQVHKSEENLLLNKK